MKKGELYEVWILGILAICVGFGMFLSWDTFNKIIGLVMILVGVIVLFSYQMLMIEESRGNEEKYREISEGTAIEKMREVTGIEDVVMLYELRDMIVILDKE